MAAERRVASLARAQRGSAASATAMVASACSASCGGAMGCGSRSRLGIRSLLMGCLSGLPQRFGLGFVGCRQAPRRQRLEGFAAAVGPAAVGVAIGLALDAGDPFGGVSWRWRLAGAAL